MKEMKIKLLPIVYSSCIVPMNAGANSANSSGGEDIISGQLG